ncbi:MAG TPA: sigma-70 family RNA polymerase sigma factor [Candidatus Paceibacterota bacterium]|jgi:RNA polymerase sigma factor (sigma-70 family)|nr:sigma-70 family RNA polymerase sigma factor [Candidatus Paceibacterota bacterium]
MKPETWQINTPKEKIKEPSQERKDLIEDVFKIYYTKLIAWCRYKLMSYNNSGKHGNIFHNLQADAEDMVSLAQLKLLTDKDPIDLKRPQHEVQKFLNNVLEWTIYDYVIEKNSQKRNPKGGLVSWEGILEDKREKDFSSYLEQYFTKSSTEKVKEEEIYHKIEQAMSKLEDINPKMADIIRKRYQQGKTQKEVSKDYETTPQNISRIEKSALKKIRLIILNMK